MIKPPSIEIKLTFKIFSYPDRMIRGTETESSVRMARFRQTYAANSEVFSLSELQTFCLTSQTPTDKKDTSE